MSQVSEGRYRLAHGDIIAQLLMRTDLSKIEQFDRIMAHVREIEAERDAGAVRQADASCTAEVDTTHSLCWACARPAMGRAGMATRVLAARFRRPGPTMAATGHDEAD
jgi:hypothetical protein